MYNYNPTYKEKEEAKRKLQQIYMREDFLRDILDVMTFENLNNAWKVKNNILGRIATNRKIEQSINLINNTVLELIFETLRTIPFIAFVLITYYLIFNFSYWNIFIGFVCWVGISFATKVIMALIGFGNFFFTDLYRTNEFNNHYVLKEYKPVTDD